MKIYLKLNVQFNVDEMRHAGISDDEIRAELEEVLERGIDHLSAEGGLSGETLATVNEWELLFSEGSYFNAGGRKITV